MALTSVSDYDDNPCATCAASTRGQRIDGRSVYQGTAPTTPTARIPARPASTRPRARARGRARGRVSDNATAAARTSDYTHSRQIASSRRVDGDASARPTRCPLSVRSPWCTASTACSGECAIERGIVTARRTATQSRTLSTGAAATARTTRALDRAQSRRRCTPRSRSFSTRAPSAACAALCA
jgi:hypothetical protein